MPFQNIEVPAESWCLVRHCVGPQWEGEKKAKKKSHILHALHNVVLRPIKICTYRRCDAQPGSSFSSHRKFYTSRWEWNISGKFRNETPIRLPSFTLRRSSNDCRVSDNIVDFKNV